MATFIWSGFFGAFFLVLGIELVAPGVFTITPVGELPLEDYVAMEADLVQVLQQEGVRPALLELITAAQADSRVMNSCHSLAHTLGRAALRYVGDFGEAFMYQDEFCNSGFIHGILEERFSDSLNVEKDMRMACESSSPNMFEYWQCHHGVGHGLMFYSENDLPASLDLCDAYSVEMARSACRNGVFMENFNVDGKLHLSQYLNPHDPFVPCASLPYQEECYLYAPIYILSLNRGALEMVVQFCDRAPSPFDVMCARGAGFQILKRNVQEAAFVQELCMRAFTQDQRSGCIEGMVNFYVHHYGGNTKEALHLCREVRSQYSALCRAHVDFLREYYSLEAI